MGNRAKLSQEGVVERADGRRLVRIFVYFDAKNSDNLKRYCFEHGVTLSSFIDETVARALKSMATTMKSERKALKTKTLQAKRKIKRKAKPQGKPAVRKPVVVAKPEPTPAIAAE